MSLDTLTNVKLRLGITLSDDDGMLDQFRASASQWIANYCERDFGGGSFTEYHPGGSEFVMLRNYPVTSVTSVKVDAARAFGSTTVVSSSAYTVHTERGVIQSLVGPFLPRDDVYGLLNQTVRHWTAGPRVVQVVYATATSLVGDDILEAYAQLVGHWYRRAKTQAAAEFVNVRSQRTGDVGVSYRVEQIAGLPIPPDVLSLLAPHRQVPC